MKNVPKKIYLQTGIDDDMEEDFNNLREVTWCKDRVNKSDICYVMKNNKSTKHKKRKK